MNNATSNRVAPAWAVGLRLLGLAVLCLAPIPMAEWYGAGPGVDPELSVRSIDFWSRDHSVWLLGSGPLFLLGGLATLQRFGFAGCRSALRGLLLGGGEEEDRRRGALALGDAARAVVLGGLALAFLGSLTLGAEMSKGVDEISPANLADCISRTLLIGIYVPLLSLLILAPAADRMGRGTGVPACLSEGWTLGQSLILVPGLLASILLLPLSFS